MLVSSLLKLFATTAAYHLISQWMGGKAGRGISTRRLRPMLWGAALVAASFMVGLLGVVLLIAALFFQLAGLADFVNPALITGGISIALAIIAFLEGMRKFRR